MNSFRAATVFAACLASVIIAGAGSAQSQGFGGWNDKPAQPAQPMPKPQQEKVFPVGATWVAISLKGKPFGGDRPTFILDSQFRMRGFGGCNTFSATSYPLREQHLAVGPLAFTKKQCDKATMASEQAFLLAMRTSVTWDIEQSILVVKTQNGELRFERAL